MGICIVGLGNIGFETLKEIDKKIKVYGYDIDEEKLNKFKEEGYNVGNELKKNDIYIIAVYTTNQIFEILNKIDYNNKPLVIVESTVDPRETEELAEFSRKNNFDLVFFPHRYAPGDPEHHVFNLDRIIGGVTEDATRRALEFYKQFMDINLIHIFDYSIVPLCKVLENAYRFMEISIAQSFKINCDKLGIDFEKLRKASNTKWNIDIKEARDGIKGKCLLKDINIFSNYFNDNFISSFMKLNDEYIKYIEKKS